MSFRLTQRDIQTLCGSTSYERGVSYFRGGKVKLDTTPPGALTFDAEVRGSSVYDVHVEIDEHGDVYADCDCPAFLKSAAYCKHIAATLLQIESLHPSDDAPSKYPSLLHSKPRSASSVSAFVPRARSDEQLADSLLGLFSHAPRRPTASGAVFETRAALQVEFICRAVPYGYRKSMFGIELRIGPKRLYIVQRIKEFLQHVDRRAAYVFGKHFIYDPQLHCFSREQDAVIQMLIKVMQLEQMYKEVASYAYASSASGGDRLLLIPPVSWDSLCPLLMACPNVKLEVDQGSYEGVCLVDEPLPLSFEFGESDRSAYVLGVHGVEGITVMEAYGLSIADGKLYRLAEGQAEQLSELKRMLESARGPRVRIPQGAIEPFMERVVPGLKKLGQVYIDSSVSDRVVQAPLRAKLYLDRVGDKLLAALEFHYGEIVVNPLEPADSQRGRDRILLRDSERERFILDKMDQALFAKTEAGYFMDNEDEEYEFLYRILPQLEKLLDVYATSAVKTRLLPGSSIPKVRADLDERTDWLEVHFDLERIPESEIRHVLQALEEKRRYHKLPDGAFLPLEGEEFQRVVKLMNDMGIRGADVQGGSVRLPALRGLHLMDTKQEMWRDSVQLGKSLRRFLENLRNPDNLEFTVPDQLASILRDYQKYGFQWMKTLAHYRFGGILADDMGLGKTLQSIAFLASVLSEIRDRRQPAIIVAPASLIYNWRNELHKFTPDIRAVIADGDKQDRKAALDQLKDVDVVITSYPLLRRDVEHYTDTVFHTLILDEAQAFKNYATQTAQSVKRLQAAHRFALTGTPIENALEELWSIYDAVFPELFHSRRLFSELSREAVSRRARPFLLRRLKSDVLEELPDKIESVQASELLPEQKRLYAAYLAKLQKDTLKHLDEDTFQKNRIRILAGLTRLRQLCCHPALFVEDYHGSSAKFEQLLEIIDECRNAGKRMLVFSQFTEMLGIISRELGYRGVTHFYLDGQTPVSERVGLCQRFNDGERELFLISLKAGGTGLNLTGADTVILYDLWWNPAVEQQAADRAHRIGQKNVVQVLRLVAQGTVEDKMYELQQRKKSLIDEVIQPGQEALSSISEREIREILSLA